MSFNGSGVFVINTTGQPVVTGTVISSSTFNTLTADLATGLSTCLTKDGQSTPTANIKLGGYKLTNVGAPTTAGDALSFGAAATISTATISTATITTAAITTLTLTNVLGTVYGGTGLTAFTSGGAVYATSTSALTTGTLPVASGGTGLTSPSTSGNVLTSTGSAWVSSAPLTAAPDVIIQDQKSSGTGPQSIADTTWETRTLNTVVRNVGGASLASSLVNLPAGTWLIQATSVIGSILNSSSVRGSIRIRNSTDSTTLAVGVNGGAVPSSTGSQGSSTPMSAVCVVTLASAKDIAVQVYTKSYYSAGATGGFATSSGEVEVYTTFEATKVA